ncbi:hypothetical protein ONZ45_g15996 [Pleurotus djamor]|nr:hypothetical protein ONZ45_g15996 [Pleurotus djamor]
MPAPINEDDVDPIVESVRLEDYVWTPEFDLECQKAAVTMTTSSSQDSNESAWSAGGASLSSATTTAEANSPHDVPEIEAHRYYAGVGSHGRGPKLIYRSSDDVFREPYGPEAYTRLMRVVPVPDSFDFGQVTTWDAIRDKVVLLLNERKIKTTSVDFVRFTWLVHGALRETEDDDDGDMEGGNQELSVSYESYDDFPPAQPIENGTRHYTNPTIWIGVLPDTLVGAVAHDSAKDILTLLESFRVQNIDVAYRESVYTRTSSPGPVLYSSMESGNPLKDIIDNVSVALSLPIASLQTTVEGTLGPYFHVGDKLYAITVRHNAIAMADGNKEYRYHGSAPKKEVMIMSNPTFETYLASIQSQIATFNGVVTSYENSIRTHERRISIGINVAESKKLLDGYRTDLARAREKVEDFKKFFVDIKKNWSNPSDRVIGFVRWAPSIEGNVAPHGYTRDLCVIELYKEKFKHMKGNVLSLGPEISRVKFDSLVWHRNIKPYDWTYPDHGLLILRGMVTSDEINNLETLESLEKRDHQDHRVHYVIKRGLATNTTIGTLTRFKSFARQYFSADVTQESLEVPILSYERNKGTFSAVGDSGSLIVSTEGKFVALLTGGTKSSGPADITYGTLFEWVWELVKAEYPGANLYFEEESPTHVA